jgi:hypothetical protein
MKLLNYGARVSFAAHESIPIATSKLKSIVHRLDPLTALTGALKEPALYGQVNENYIELHCMRPFFGVHSNLYFMEK